MILFNVDHSFTCSWMLSKSSIWPIDGTLIDTTTPSQSGPGSNSDKGELHIHKSYRIGSLPSDAVYSHTQDTHWGVVTLLQYSTAPADKTDCQQNMVLGKALSIVHYLHLLDYCPYLRRHDYHNVSVVVRGGWNVELNPLFRLPGWTVLVLRAKFNGYQLSSVNSPYKSSPLPSPSIELTFFGYVIGSIQRLYPLYHMSLCEFLSIINLMSSATIFTSAHMAILQWHTQVQYSVKAEENLQRGN